LLHLVGDLFEVCFSCSLSGFLYCFSVSKYITMVLAMEDDRHNWC